MATMKAIGIARLYRDAQVKAFKDTSLVILPLVVSKPSKKDEHGNYIPDPKALFIDAEFWRNEGNGKLFDVLGTLKKGMRVYINGDLVGETWEDRVTGQKRSRYKVVLREIEFLDPKGESATTDASPTPSTEDEFDVPF